MGIIAIISSVLQLIYLILKNKAEKDVKEKARKDALHQEAANAIKSGDLSAINNVFDKLRKS